MSQCSEELYGNVLSQTITANSGATTIGVQSYSYDGVNRLSGATEAPNGTPPNTWTQTYDYDQFGNRAVRNTSYIPRPQLAPQSTSGTDFSAFNQATNRIALSGFGYDNAGNLTSDPTAQANGIVYGAEKHQTSYAKTGSQATIYVYDGEMRRVQKQTGAAITVFVYNVFGQLIAEYGGTAANGGTSYLTTDHLGSTRVVTDANKAVIARHDYLPYGEEIPSGIGIRTPGLGYVPTDDTRQRFTSKERDGESSLDYFGARYYSSTQGRFTSIDPMGLKAQTLADPQRLSRYAYVRGNPLKFFDPNGEDLRLATELNQRAGRRTESSWLKPWQGFT